MARRAGPGGESEGERLGELIRKAQEAPENLEGWDAVFRLALRTGNFDAAERAARRSGERETVLLAELAIARGKAGDAAAMLKGRNDPDSRSMTAWAFFCMDQRLSAAAVWWTTGDGDEASLGQAITMMVKGSPAPEVIAMLEKTAASVNPRVTAASVRLLAELFLKNDERAKSLTWARRAEWLMPFDLTVKKLVARLAVAEKQPDLALARWREILKVSPEDPEANEALGHEALRTGDTTGAVLHFEAALAADPFRCHLRVQLGDLARQVGKEELAVEHWETTLRINPKFRLAHQRLAEFRWDKGDLAESLEHHLRLKEIGFPDQEVEENFEAIGYLYSEILLGGNTAIEPDARRFFAEAIQKFPANPILMVYEARRHVALEQYEEAKALVKQALGIDPMMPEAIYELGNLLIIQGDRTAGMKLLHRASTIDPDPFYPKELARNYLDMDDWTNSEKWFKKALSSGAEDEELLLGLYLTLFNQQKYSTAENVLRRALALSPDHLQALANLAEVLMLVKKPDEAYAIMKNVIDVAITYDEYLEGRGSAELVVDPAGVMPWLMGYAAFFTGHASVAKKYLAKALKDAPQMEDWFAGLKNLAVQAMDSDPSFSRKMKDPAALILRVRH